MDGLKGYLKTGTILRQNQIWAYTASQATAGVKLNSFSFYTVPIQEHQLEPNRDPGISVNIYLLNKNRNNFDPASKFWSKTNDSQLSTSLRNCYTIDKL